MDPALMQKLGVVDPKVAPAPPKAGVLGSPKEKGLPVLPPLGAGKLCLKVVVEVPPKAGLPPGVVPGMLKVKEVPRFWLLPNVGFVEDEPKAGGAPAALSCSRDPLPAERRPRALPAAAGWLGILKLNWKGAEPPMTALPSLLLVVCVVTPEPDTADEVAVPKGEGLGILKVN